MDKKLIQYLEEMNEQEERILREVLIRGTFLEGLTLAIRN